MAPPSPPLLGKARCVGAMADKGPASRDGLTDRMEDAQLGPEAMPEREVGESMGR